LGARSYRQVKKRLKAKGEGFEAREDILGTLVQKILSSMRNG
jgi:hypothetical protein